MASPVGHALIGCGVAVLAASFISAPLSAQLVVSSAIAANLPDADWLPTVVGVSSSKTHRKGTHSLVILGVAVFAVGWVWRTITGELHAGILAALTAALFSHPFLDVVTTSRDAAARGFGIPLMWPFMSRRWALLPPIAESPEPKTLWAPGMAWKALLRELAILGPIGLSLMALGALLPIP